MKEELYIILASGERKKLDLGDSSGITLNFKSNIFGDLSKITCSYSYTFKLPLTTNNRQVLDNSEDVRHQSAMIRKRLKAEFIQNGIPLFSNANLYIDSVETDYKAVLTWGVVEGFEGLKDNDISLVELPSDISDIVRFQNIELQESSTYSNDAEYLHPLRKVTNLFNGYIASAQVVNTLPVVPIRKIISKINECYGTKFNLGALYTGNTSWNSTIGYVSTKDDDLINRGVVPLVNCKLTQKQREARIGILSNFVFLNNSFLATALPFLEGLDAHDIITFDIQEPEIGGYYEIGSENINNTNYKFTFYKKALSSVEKIILDGRFIFLFENIGARYKKDTGIAEFDRTEVIPQLIVKQKKFQLKEGSSTNGEIIWDDAVTLNGIRAYDNDYSYEDDTYHYHFYAFEFDFRESNGKKRLSIDDFQSTNATYPCVLIVTEDIKECYVADNIKMIPDGMISDNMLSGFEIDINSNLPDISCMTFMKSLFYMMGAFPNVNKNNEIVPLFYGDIEANIKNGNALNWSSRIMGNRSALAQKIDFKVAGFAQRNYYLLKNDDLEMTDEEYEEEEDIYESGLGVIEVDNETLDTSKTIIQLPFYGPYILDRKWPSLATGNDVKNEKRDDDGNIEFCESKPAIGMIRSIPEVELEGQTEGSIVYTKTGRHIMFMDIWNGVKNITNNKNYAYLQKIVKRPFVITEYLNLNEFDLRDLDYTVPIYLDKYNSYFAVVSVTRDSKGKCKCELLKLP